jgi:hypothetical protein
MKSDDDGPVRPLNVALDHEMDRRTSALIRHWCTMIVGVIAFDALKGRGKSESRWQNNVLSFNKAKGHWKDDGTWGQKQKKPQ